MNIDPLWSYIYERESIRLRRESGAPRPWTTDAILALYKFTNVYREHDRVTRWMAKHVREPLQNDPSLIHACIAFRWFNRLSVGEAIFVEKDECGHTAWENYCITGDLETLKQPILKACGKGPYVTGVYIIKTPQGYNKLDGVLNIIDRAIIFARNMQWLPVGAKLQDAYDHLINAPYMGTFTAAQVIADIKYTPKFRGASDWNTFVQSGPGSRAGLNIVCRREPFMSWREAEWVATVLELREQLLPRFAEQNWELPHAQDVQNMLCEYSKYIRGYSRNIFSPTTEAL